MNIRKLLIAKWKKILPLTAIILLLVIVSIPQVTPKMIQSNILRTVSAAGITDYALTGTNDNAIFQLALDDLPATGGTLQVVSTGTIDWANGVTVTRVIDNVVIQGAGTGTLFDGDGVTAIFTAGGDYWAFRDFATDAGGIDTGVTFGWSMTNILIDTDYYAYQGSLFDGDVGDFTYLSSTELTAPTGRGATLVVAANDASDVSKAQADYVCDGTADNVEIQAAIDALNVANGGVVQLTEGNYSGAAIYVKDSVGLRGMGMYATTYTVTSGSSELRANSQIEDITIDANDIAGTSGLIILGSAKAARTRVLNFNVDGFLIGDHTSIPTDVSVLSSIADKGTGSGMGSGFQISGAPGGVVRRINLIDDYSINANQAGFFISTHNAEFAPSGVLIQNSTDNGSVVSFNIIGDAGATTHASDIIVNGFVSDAPDNNNINLNYVETAVISDFVGRDAVGSMGIDFDNIQGVVTLTEVQITGQDEHAIYSNSAGGTVKINGGYYEAVATKSCIYNDGGPEFVLTGVHLDYSAGGDRGIYTTSRISVVGGTIYGIGGTSRAIDIRVGADYSLVNGVDIDAPYNIRNYADGGVFTSNQLDGAYGFEIQAGSDNGLYEVNNITQVTAANRLADAGAGNIVRNNLGYVTENSGTATIASGTTSIVINHGLSLTPSAKNFSIVFLENATATPGASWIDTITATQATINIENDPGASNLDVGWSYSNN